MRLTLGTVAGNSTSLMPFGVIWVCQAGRAIHLGVPEFVGATGANGTWFRCLEHSGPVQVAGGKVGVDCSGGDAMGRPPWLIAVGSP